MIRRLGPEEGALWRALLLESVERHPECFVTTLDKMRAIPAVWFDSQITRQVVVTAGQDNAFGVLEQMDDGARLHSLYVRSAVRGTGLADAIVSHLCAEAARRGIAQLSLGVLEDNRRAVRLYERHGFTMATKKPLGDRVDCTMVKLLSPGP